LTKKGWRAVSLDAATVAVLRAWKARQNAERLGHATISQTLDTYSHTAPALHESAADSRAAIMDGEA
jgi:hypothetical protein